MPEKHCYSCCTPLIGEMISPLENFCSHCVKEDGTLNTREEAQVGMAEWFMSWQPNLDKETALIRAGHYMNAMPHWAE